MGDVIDRAQQYDEMYRESAIAAHFAGQGPRPDGFRPIECMDCGGEIPAARRQAAPGTLRCVGCQGKHERLYGRQS
jgi:phage/conjugal plasmid C-4 type zinc finger TraR family protein